MGGGGGATSHLQTMQVQSPELYTSQTACSMSNSKCGKLGPFVDHKSKIGKGYTHYILFLDTNTLCKPIKYSGPLMYSLLAT